MCCRQRAHSGDELGGEEEQRLGSVSVLSNYAMLSRSPWQNVQHTMVCRSRICHKAQSWPDHFQNWQLTCSVQQRSPGSNQGVDIMLLHSHSTFLCPDERVPE